MKKFLHEYRNYILLSSMIFLISFILFFVLAELDQRFTYYDEAIREIKDDSLVPKSVTVYRASYDEQHIYIEFSDKNLEGEETGKILAVYTYNSEDQNGLKYYFQGNTNYGIFYAELIHNQSFPPYVLGHEFHPFIIFGIISLIFALFTFVISRVKWHDKAIDSLNETDDENDLNDIEIVDKDNL